MQWFKLQKAEFLKKIGSKIVEIRKEKKISQAKLAWQLGKDPQSIERIENGKINTSIFNLKEIADALEVELKDLFVDL